MQRLARKLETSGSERASGRNSVVMKPDSITKIEPLWGPGVPVPESYIGQWMLCEEQRCNKELPELMQQQVQLQQLYESRFASMHRMVGFLVMFHAMAKKVQDFWPMVSFGLLGYDMSRSQSMMRIATTASPVSGSDVRHKMLELARAFKRNSAVRLLQSVWMKKHGVWLHELAKEGRFTVDDLNQKIESLEKLRSRALDKQTKRRQSIRRGSVASRPILDPELGLVGVVGAPKHQLQIGKAKQTGNTFEPRPQAHKNSFLSERCELRHKRKNSPPLTRERAPSIRERASSVLQWFSTDVQLKAAACEKESSQSGS